MYLSILKRGFRQACSRLGWWVPPLIVVSVLAAWEWAAREAFISTLFFPAPSVITRTLIRSITAGDFLPHLGATLSRVFGGFMLGSAPAILIGLTIGWSHRLRSALDPLIAAAHPIPKIALMPMIMIFFGIGEFSKVIIVAVTVFFPMVINCMAGVQQISPIHFEVAKNYGARPFKVFSRVVVPGGLPMVMAGARLALNIALMVTIAVEMIAAQEGLGRVIWFAWESMQTEYLYAGVAVTAFLGIGINFLLKRVTRYLVPWQVAR